MPHRLVGYLSVVGQFIPDTLKRVCNLVVDRASGEIDAS